MHQAQILSKELKMHCRVFTVRLLCQQLGAATPGEQAILNIAENNSLIREVHLCGDGVPWVLGRTIVPYATYLRFKEKFDGLGESPLGETMLYGRDGVTRSGFMQSLTADGLLCRASVFEIAGSKLLVAETFLHECPQISIATPNLR